MKLYNREIWDKIQPSDKWESKCIFCFETMEKEYLIKETKYFYILHNKYPFLGSDKHLLVAPKRHIILTTELNKEEWQDFEEVEKFMSEFYKWMDYFSFIRQSNTDISRSINHLHYHYVEWMIRGNYIMDMLKQQWQTDKLENKLYIEY